MKKGYIIGWMIIGICFIVLITNNISTEQTKDSKVYVITPPETETELEPSIYFTVNCSDSYKGVCLDDFQEEHKEKIKSLIDGGWSVTPIEEKMWGETKINGGYIAVYQW